MANIEIVSLEAWNVREPDSKRGWCVVRLAAKNGSEGWGECHTLTREGAAALKTAITGVDAYGYEPIRAKLKSMPGAGAVNIACIDLAARSAKAPAYQFLGGPTRNKARAFCTLHGESDDALLASMREAMKAGHKAFGVPIPQTQTRNQGQAFVHAARRRLDALRGASGDDHDFVLQGSASIRAGDASSLATIFEKFHLLWFDEPCDTRSLGALRKIAEENVTPLGFGQDLDGAAFQNLLREGAIDVVRPELAVHGISGCRKIAALAEVYYVAAAPRHGEGPINTAAALHLAASLPNFVMQHIPRPATEADRRMRAGIAGGVETVQAGFAALPTDPGLGIRVDRAALRQYGEQIA